MSGKEIKLEAGCSKNMDNLAFWILCAIPVIYVPYVFFHRPEIFVSLISEDNIGETLTAIFALAAGIIAGRKAFHSRKVGKPSIWLALFALGAILIGLEEISWFSRYVHYNISFIQERNLQGEVNLHNLGSGFKTLEFTIGPVLIVLYGVLLPLFVIGLGNKFRFLVKKYNFPLPPLQAVPIFLGTALLLNFGKHIGVYLPKGSEIAELFLAIGLWATAAWIKVYPGSTARSRQWILSWSICVFVSLVLVQFGPQDLVRKPAERRSVEFTEKYYPSLGMAKQSVKLLKLQRGVAKYSSATGRTLSAIETNTCLKYNLLRKGTEKEDYTQGIRSASKYAWLDLADCWINLAILARLSGDYKQACNYLDKAEMVIKDGLASSPEDKELKFSMAKIHACCGNYAEALEYLDSDLNTFRKNVFSAFVQQQKTLFLEEQ